MYSHYYYFETREAKINTYLPYFQLDQVSAAMVKVNWEKKEVGTDHNPYVDILIREFRQYKNRLDTNP